MRRRARLRGEVVGGMAVVSKWASFSSSADVLLQLHRCCLACPGSVSKAHSAGTASGRALHSHNHGQGAFQEGADQPPHLATGHGRAGVTSQPGAAPLGAVGAVHASSLAAAAVAGGHKPVEAPRLLEATRAEAGQLQPGAPQQEPVGGRSRVAAVDRSRDGQHNQARSQGRAALATHSLAAGCRRQGAAQHLAQALRRSRAGLPRGTGALAQDRSPPAVPVGRLHRRPSARRTLAEARRNQGCNRGRRSRPLAVKWPVGPCAAALPASFHAAVGKHPNRRLGACRRGSP